MRYILDSNGYIEEIIFGGTIVCNNNSCTEYIGDIPSGYTSLVEWADNANIRAYKIENNNLTYDSAKDEELQAQWEKEELNNILEKENYSTEEQVIGKWLGKTLYRKVVTYNNTETIGSTGTMTTVSIPHNISNIDLVVNHKLIMSKVNNIQYMFPAYNGDSAVKKGTVISEIHDTNILMRIINDTWGAGKTFYIILEYTKTTD